MSGNKDLRRKLGIWAALAIAVGIMVSSAIVALVGEVTFAVCTLFMAILAFLIGGYVLGQWSTINPGELYA